MFARKTVLLALALFNVALFHVALSSRALAESSASAETAPADLLTKSRRIVFLGDSITASGQYVAEFEAWLLTRKLPSLPLVIDAGLPSETVSGLSEDGHAGGQFPRPDLNERLDRVLKLTKPDLVFACYGINCGIYQPFDQQRFERYQKGIENLKQKVQATGARLVLITPPFYDDARAKLPFFYNAVLDRYSSWLIGKRADGWMVVDLHEPMTREVNERRKTDPAFTFQADGVHPNDAGHWFVAQQLCHWLGDDGPSKAATPQEMLKTAGLPQSVLSLCQQRMSVLRDAYVATAGHKRPGVAAGLSVADADKKAAQLSTQIREAR